MTMMIWCLIFLRAPLLQQLARYIQGIHQTISLWKLSAPISIQIFWQAQQWSSVFGWKIQQLLRHWLSQFSYILISQFLPQNRLGVLFKQLSLWFQLLRHRFQILAILLSQQPKGRSPQLILTLQHEMPEFFKKMISTFSSLILISGKNKLNLTSWNTIAAFLILAMLYLWETLTL